MSGNKKCKHKFEVVYSNMVLVGGNLWEDSEYRCIYCGKTVKQIILEKEGKENVQQSGIQ